MWHGRSRMFVVLLALADGLTAEDDFVETTAGPTATGVDPTAVDPPGIEDVDIVVEGLTLRAAIKTYCIDPNRN